MKYGHNYRLIFFLIIVFILSGQPFLFYSLVLSNTWSLILKIVILFALSFMLPFRLAKHGLIVATFIILFSIITSVLHPAYFKQVLNNFPDFIFWGVTLSTIAGNTQLRTRLYAIEKNFSIVVGLSIILCYFSFKFIPSLFAFENADGYPIGINPLLGCVSIGKDRPCWFFAEPSYCGLFLGLNIFLVLSEYYSNKKRKFFNLLILSIALFFTASLGSYIYIFVALLFYAAERFKLNQKILRIFLYVVIVALIVILPNFEVANVMISGVDMKSTSYFDRQERMLNASEVMDSMSTLDFMFGKGIEYVTIKYKKGLSNAYDKFLCEYGLFYLLIVLWWLRSKLKSNIPIFAFTLISMISVIVCMAPIYLLIYLCVETQALNCKHPTSF